MTHTSASPMFVRKLKNAIRPATGPSDQKGHLARVRKGKCCTNRLLTLQTRRHTTEIGLVDSGISFGSIFFPFFLLPNLIWPLWMVDFPLQWTTRGGPSEFAIQDHRLFQFFCWNVSLQASVLMLFTLTETSNSTYYDEFDDSDDFALMVGDFAADILFPTQAILVQWLAANKVSMSLLTSLHLCRILLSVPSALFNCHSARISW